MKIKLLIKIVSKIRTRVMQLDKNISGIKILITMKQMLQGDNIIFRRKSKTLNLLEMAVRS